MNESASTARIELGLIIPPDQPPERFRPTAVAAEAAGLDEVWLWEDCFAESGVGPAAALLSATERIRVGIGLMPVALRNVALTAMEIASLARMFPGRLVPGIGHGVLDWMGQAGVRAASPLTLMREYTIALRALLAGETVTTTGRYVTLDDVTLRWPVDIPPPLFIGAIGERTLALAGEVADGVIFTGGTGPDAVAAALQVAGEARHAARREGPPEAVVFCDVPVDATADRIASDVSGLTAAGATRVAVLAIGPDGPEGSERLVEFAGVVGEVRRQLG